MKKKSDGFDFLEYDAASAAKLNFEWFAALSPGKKIRAMERATKDLIMLKKLKQNGIQSK